MRCIISSIILLLVTHCLAQYNPEDYVILSPGNGYSMKIQSNDNIRIIPCTNDITSIGVLGTSLEDVSDYYFLKDMNLPIDEIFEIDNDIRSSVISFQTTKNGVTTSHMASNSAYGDFKYYLCDNSITDFSSYNYCCICDDSCQ